MTIADYKALVRELGLTPMKPSCNGCTIHQWRDGKPYSVPDPETMTEPQRKAALELLKTLLGIEQH